MKTHKDIQQEVVKTLASFDDLEDIEVNPFFAARVQARIQAAQRQKSPSSGRLFGAARMRFAALIALVVINLVSFVSLLQTSQVHTNDRQTSLSAFAEEYGFTQDDEISFFE